MSLYAIILGIIVIALLAVSLSRLRGIKTKADYLVAGRTLPWYILVFTLLSSWIGAGSLFAGAENAYYNGFAALWKPAGGWAGLVIIYFVAPRARKFAQFTIPDLLEARFNTAARVLGVIAILFAYTAITSYQFKAGGNILHLIFPDVSSGEGTVMIAIFVIVFTAIAGMASVAYMDVFIGSLVIVTSLIAVPVLLSTSGGWAGLHDRLPAEYFQLFGRFGYDKQGVHHGLGAEIAKAFEYFLPVFLLMLGNQNMYQKFFSAKTARDARIAVGGWIFGTLVLETIIVAIAVFGTSLFMNAPDVVPYNIIPFTARNGMPVFIGALMMGAIFAKVISTANNYLFSPATNLINDVYSRFIAPGASQKNVLITSRILVFALGAWALIQAVHLESILAKALYAYTIYSAAITPVVMAAFFWRRATASAAVTSIALGTLVTVFWNEAKPWIATVLSPEWAARDAIYPALVTSLVALVVVSYATKPPSREHLDIFYGNQEP